MASPTKIAQNTWTTSGQLDFLQLVNEQTGGVVIGWIDYTGTGQGTLANGGGSVNFADEIVPTGGIPGSSFTLPNAPNPSASLLLFWNGILLKPGGVDYTLSGNSITTVQTVESRDSFLAWYRH